jgi:hypothetical protein
VTYKYTTRRILNSVGLIAGLLVTQCVQNEGMLKFSTKAQIVSSGPNCKVHFTYPVISIQESDVAIDSLNGLLRRVNFDEALENYCQKVPPAKQMSVTSAYSVLLNTDSLACLEYVLTISHLSKNIYKPFFIDVKTRTAVDPKIGYPLGDTRKLLPFVKKFSEANANVNINLSIYEQNKVDAISYGLTPQDLILYVGAEGELYGTHKIFIPLKELEPPR